MNVTHREVIVIGGGPSGLAAAIEAARYGAQVLLVDANRTVGGQLFKQIHKFFGSSAHKAGVRGIDIGAALVQEAQALDVEIWPNSVVVGAYAGNKIAVDRGDDLSGRKLEVLTAERVVIATGGSENAVRFEGWTMPGVMGAGAAQTMINVNRVLPGKRILMVGSGNVGLIVSYQLMQAGARVVALLEAKQEIGGYAVHAAKIARAGVPILTGHTVKRAVGIGRVEKAVICKVDGQFQDVPGSEQALEVDAIAIAVGLTPLQKVAKMFGCEMAFEPAFSGWVPLHDEWMESSVSDVYVVGDSTGIEEANTALEEGRLAGIAIAGSLGYLASERMEALKNEIWIRLDGLRGGEQGRLRRLAKCRQMGKTEAVG